MAEQFSPAEILALKEREPDRAVAAYVNTTAELKAVSDVCVTSSTAVKIVERMDSDKILFIPDGNLGAYVKKRVNKDVMLLSGCCPVHDEVTPADLQTAREQYPNAQVLVHPECPTEVTENADFIGATSHIIDYARKSEHTEFIIGTELAIMSYLQYECPDKRFYPLTKNLICPDMRLTTLPDVLCAVEGIGDGKAFEVVVEEKIRVAAEKAIREMIRLGS